MTVLKRLSKSIIHFEQSKMIQLMEEALKNYDPQVILDKSLKPAMIIVGEEYERGERFIPEMIMSAEAMKEAMGVLNPLFEQSGGHTTEGVVVLGTVKGDLHDIGLNLVSMMLEGAGFKVYKLGTDVSVAKFIDAAQEIKPDVLGMSALLTSTMAYMPKVIRALQESDLREKVKVIIGGAPVTQDYADEIEADGYGRDAGSAVKVVKGFLK